MTTSEMLPAVLQAVGLLGLPALAYLVGVQRKPYGLWAGLAVAGLGWLAWPASAPPWFQNLPFWASPEALAFAWVGMLLFVGRFYRTALVLGALVAFLTSPFTTILACLVVPFGAWFSRLWREHRTLEQSLGGFPPAPQPSLSQVLVWATAGTAAGAVGCLLATARTGVTPEALFLYPCLTAGGTALGVTLGLRRRSGLNALLTCGAALLLGALLGGELGSRMPDGFILADWGWLVGGLAALIYHACGEGRLISLLVLVVLGSAPYVAWWAFTYWLLTAKPVSEPPGGRAG